jgi:hypothetical protein
VSEPFDGRCRRNHATFHGRVSTNRVDKGFQNYLNLLMDSYKICVFLNGVEHHATMTADPGAGMIEICNGAHSVTLNGYVEIRLERIKDKRGKGRMPASRL